MAKAMYIGVSDKSRKTKKAYIGVDGKARKIKKMYIGVNGVARLFFSGSTQFKYLKSITGLSNSVDYLAAASTTNYALFAGGTYQNDTRCNAVDVYNTSLSKHTTTTIPYSTEYPSWQNYGTTFNGCAVIAGGKTGDESSSDRVFVFNDSLSRSDYGLTFAAHNLGVGATSTHVIIGGGKSNWDHNNNVSVNAFNSSFSRTELANLTNGGPRLVASNKNYMIFAGGLVDSKAAEGYNTSLSKVSVPSLSADRGGGVGLSVGQYLLFVYGGETYSPGVTDVYNNSLTRSTTARPPLGYAAYPVGTSLPEHAVVCAGLSTTHRTEAYAYDESLTLTSANITVGRVFTAMTALKNYAIIGGGKISNGTEETTTNSVEVLTEV